MRENKSDSLPDLRFSLNHTGFAGSDKGPPARGFALARAVYSRRMSPNVYPVRIVMLRRRTAGRWAGETCEAVAVLPGVADDAPGVEPLVTLHGESRYLVRGLALDLHRDEAEGYYLNVSAAEPKVFVIVRASEHEALALPLLATVSFGEAARALDSGEQVDGVPMSPEIYAWVGGYVEAHYRPEPERKGPRRDKPSFASRR